jgi:acyl carrier protein
MTDVDAIANELRAYLVEEFLFGEGEIDDQQSLFDEGVLDSMSFLLVLAHFRERYGVEVAMADITLEAFSTVDRMARYLAQHGGQP